MRVKEPRKTVVRSAKVRTRGKNLLVKNIDNIMLIRIEIQFHRKVLDNFLHIHCDATCHLTILANPESMIYVLCLCIYPSIMSVYVRSSYLVEG